MNDPNPMIFIAGNSRSGTTMMSRIMGNHKSIHPFQELHFFDELTPSKILNNKLDYQQALKLFATLMAVQRNGYFGSRDTGPFAESARNTLSSSESHTPASVYKTFLLAECRQANKHIPCEQTPQNVHYLEQILNLYPGARFILMVRDPREVLLSQKFKWKRRKLSGGKIPLLESVRSRINYHPITISKIWKMVMSKVNHFRNHERVIAVRYEDLISSPETTIRKVCDFLQIEFQATMLNIPVVGSSNFIDSSQQGIDNTRQQQWRNGGLSPAEITLCQEINSDIMLDWGYEVEKIASSSYIMLWYRISQPVKMVASIPFNLHRIKNMGRILSKALSG
jgi:omega-hydroxy-beta-dihydromenaquinone-9 sulfotransferase